MFPRSPDFIGIGAQKAGTTWLYENLRRHPNIWMPPFKEIHYFDRTLENLEGINLPLASSVERFDNKIWRDQTIQQMQNLVTVGSLEAFTWKALFNLPNIDDNWYRGLFCLAPESSTVGEITPRYALCGDKEIAQMQAVAPNAKLFFMLRNPVERFWSQCQMNIANGSLPNDEAAIISFFNTFHGRPRGEYSETILKFCQYYDPSQVLLIFQDALKETPQKVMQGVFSFLGLPECNIDLAILAERVFATKNSQPMPERLRCRIAASYRREMEVLAEVLSGYAAQWINQELTAKDRLAALQLSAAHIDNIKKARQHHRKQSKEKSRIFCISMQRNGTTSVGDWLEAHGLIRVGSPTAVRLGWPRLWMEGNYDAIFQSSEFEKGEIFEDNPWWFSDFYKIIIERFPESKFILLYRDSNDWFDSLCHHSAGRNPGWSDIHARIYNREEDLHRIMKERRETDPTKWHLLSIVEHREYYKTIYERYNQEVKDYFSNQPDRLFYRELENPQTFIDMCDFAGVKHNPMITIPRSNARTVQMAQRLKAYLSEVRI